MSQGRVALLIVGGAALALGVVGYRAATHTPKEAQRAPLSVQPTVRYEPAPAPVTPAVFRPPPMTPAPRPEPVSPVAPPPAPVAMPQPPRPEQDPARQARHAPLLAYGAVGERPSRGGQGEGGGAAPVGASGRQGELAARLVPTNVTAVSATVLRNQPYLLTRGTQVQCVLLTAIDSTLPGPISCRLPQDVLGKTGLVLLDRGSIIVGETGGNMQQGQNRLFALWTRAETPNGIVINLDSPGADPLGRSGFDGDVDKHFMERIGGALLLSLVQGAIQIGANAVAPQGSSSLNLGGTESAVAEALRGSVNIRPTLRMNQGDLVSIAVIRDLDFSTVYKLSVR